MRRRKTSLNSSQGRRGRFGYGLYPSEECNIAGCSRGRMQGLHSSLSTFALLHSSFVLQNYRIGCHVAKVFQMKSATLQVVSEEGCRVCILLLSAFALVHSSFVFLNYKINYYVAKIFQMKSATLQVVSEKGCRVCILLLSAFCIVAFFFFCPTLRPEPRSLSE